MASTDQNSSSGVLGSLGITAPPSGTATDTKILGVPKGYKAPTYTHSGYVIPQGDATHQTPQDYGPITTNVYGSSVGPGYTEADKFGPAADPTNIPTIQAEMIQAGLLNAKDVRPGVWDSASANAYGDVLSFANQNGLNAADALTLMTANPPLGSKTQGPGPRTIAFTNPQDAATTYQNVSQQLTGQEQDPAQFIQQYHADEAAQAGTNGTNYTQAPSLTGAATQYVQNNMPGQEMAYGVASRMNDFFSMLGGQ